MFSLPATALACNIGGWRLATGERVIMEERKEGDPPKILFRGIPESWNPVHVNSIVNLNPASSLIPKISLAFREMPVIANQAAMQNIAQAMSVVCDAWQSMGAIQAVREATENISSSLNLLAERCLAVNSDVIEKLRDTARSLRETTAFLRCCKETNWPIYWDCDRGFEGKVAEIELQYDEGSIDEALRKELVAEAVLSYYDQARVKAIGERWANAQLVGEGQQRLLAEAIGRHIGGDYLAATAILACLSGGLTEKFYWSAFEAGLFSDEELSLVAEVYNVPKPSKTKATARAQVLSLGLCTEEGALYWDAACKYIANIMLASGKDWESLAEENPLRNKICHGEQTNYDTEVHSLKAILAVDLLLRLGAVVEEAAADEDKR